MVTIKLNLNLVDIVGKKETVLTIKEPTLLTDILNEIGLSKEMVGIVIRNNRWTSIESIIEINDEIQLFPKLYGG